MILVFGGTTEGRIVTNVLDESGKEYYYSTKGEDQKVKLVHGIRLTGAMTEERMRAYIKEFEIKLIIDAAHPFAEVLHQTIGLASLAEGCPVIRYERQYPELDERIICCDTYDEMVEKMLAQPSHRLLSLTGVNTIPKLKKFWLQRETFCRILDRDDSREKAIAAGFPISHIRYFKEGEDQALFDEIQPDAITTKESGSSGFFLEKIAPALEQNIPVYMISRPKLPKHFQNVSGPVGLRKAVERIVPEFFPLKTGFTTGTTATAATIAAFRALLKGEQCSVVSVKLPSEELITFPIEGVEKSEKGFTATTIKRSGDDPDVTNGIEICSEVSWAEDGEIHFLQGEGVGKVTLPGIGLEVGEPAINKTPRAMIRGAIREMYPKGGVNVRIFIPQGEEIATKTFNPRLGIVGGISVIGTSGVVKPFSSAAFIASIGRQVDVALALGADTIVINSGAKSERYLKAQFPELPPQSFVQYGNYIGETLEKLAEHHVPMVRMGIMLGKAVKLAEGKLDTHSRKVVMNKDFLHRVATECSCSEAAHTLIDELTMAKQLWVGLSEADLTPMLTRICQLCHKATKALVPESKLTLLLIDDEGNIRFTKED